jgi:hypothetical protein
MTQTIKQFWKEYLELDYFEKREKLKTLPFIKDLPKLLDSKKYGEADYVTLMTYLITSNFQSYTDDIIESLKEKGDKQ